MGEQTTAWHFAFMVEVTQMPGTWHWLPGLLKVVTRASVTPNR